MNPRHLLSACLTLLLCLFMGNVEAQCTRSQSSSTKTKTKTNVEQTQQTRQAATNSCTKARTYYSCSKYRAEYCRKKKEDDKPALNAPNTLMVLGGATILPDNNDNEVVVATGLEYRRNLGKNFGLGLAAEVRPQNETVLRLAVPVSYRIAGKLQISASPLANFQQHDVETVTGGTFENPEVGIQKEWDTTMGARAGISYLVSVGHLIIAPTVKADFLGDNVEPTVGINFGLGF